MLRIVACLLLLLSLPLAPLRAQQNISNLHRQTTTPPNARFEIIQSEISVRLTFRLDRFTGRIDQLVQTGIDANKWEEMQVTGLPKIPAPARPRFQIFTSGITARSTFLIDTDTGKTWLRVPGQRRGNDGTEYGVSLWQPFTE